MQTHAEPPQTGAMPSPDRIMRTLCAFQESAALKGAIELDLFTAIAEGASTVPEIARRVQASEKGVRVLCDYLTIIEYLTKQDGRYGLSPEAGAFLNKHSPAYMGSIAGFLTSEHVMRGFKDMAAAVRKGGSVVEQDGGLDPEHPMWVEFARSMVPMMGFVAQLTAERVAGAEARKVLDIAAGHGLFGISIAQRNPHARIVASDWANVLELAKQHARGMGVGDRYETLPGDAFSVDFGSEYDLVLVPNFLHHFDTATNEGLLRKVHSCLKPSGTVAVVEFVPNEDRVSPMIPASFSLMMLGGTPSGDAYTYPELERMLNAAGFSGVSREDLVPTPQTLITGAA